MPPKSFLALAACTISAGKLSAINFPERPYIDFRWDCILDVAPQYTDTYTFNVKVVLEDDTALEGSASFTIKGVE